MTRPIARTSLYCQHCEADLRYEGFGEWRCDCGQFHLADWIDGPGFCKWLKEDMGITNLESRSASLARRVRDWEKGDTMANAYTVDYWLMKVGLHLSMVPDHLWRHENRQTEHRERQAHLRAKAVARLRECNDRQQVAEEFGISTHTLKAWNRGRTG